MVAFGFLTQNFGRSLAHTNGTLSFCECRFSGGDTLRWWGHSNSTLKQKNLFELLAHTGSGDAKTLDMNTCAQTQHSYPSHLVEFPGTIFLSNWFN